jgi:uncharacterized protein YqjF (DUF2071 family)
VFLLCHCSVLLSLAVLVVLVAFVAFVLPFVFAALVVCAAGGVLHVVVAEREIKQNSKEASRKTKSNESRTNTMHRIEQKQRNKKTKEKQTNGKAIKDS